MAFAFFARHHGLKAPWYRQPRQLEQNMEASHNESLGRRISRMRLSHGMTQERLANIANVSAQAVSKWENDQSYPDIMLLPLLAKTFGVTVDELLGIVDAGTSAEPPTERQAEPVAEPIAEPSEETNPTSHVDVEPEAVPEAGREFSLPDDASNGMEERLDLEGTATRIHLRVTRGGREAVNLSLPLAAAQIFANVARYFPDKLVEGVDLVELAQSARSAGRGTLVDIDDEDDRVVITLE